MMHTTMFVCMSPKAGSSHTKEQHHGVISTLWRKNEKVPTKSTLPNNRTKGIAKCPSDMSLGHFATSSKKEVFLLHRPLLAEFAWGEARHSFIIARKIGLAWKVVLFGKFLHAL